MVSRTAFGVMLLAAAAGIGCWSHYKGEDVTRRELDEPEEIGGVPCRGSATLDEDDRLLSCTLSRDADIGKAHLPEGTWVRFHPDGTIKYCFLPGDTRIQGHVCRGKGHDYMTTFHSSGSLRLCWLAEDETIQGIPCVKATTSGEIFGRLAGRGGPGVVFHENGNLQGCKLAEALVFDGKEVKAGRRVTLDEDGNLVEP